MKKTDTSPAGNANAHTPSASSRAAPGFRDRFGASANQYARYRPSYPAALFAHLASAVPLRTLAIDVGCGTGQSARGLAECFHRVIGCDGSAGQIELAREDAERRHLSNIQYHVRAMSALDESDDTLITY
jgi:SAM-dependent methyltransferase